jgi:hypothetical protein
MNPFIGLIEGSDPLVNTGLGLGGLTLLGLGLKRKFFPGGRVKEDVARRVGEIAKESGKSGWTSALGHPLQAASAFLGGSPYRVEQARKLQSEVESLTNKLRGIKGSAAEGYLNELTSAGKNLENFQKNFRRAGGLGVATGVGLGGTALYHRLNREEPQQVIDPTANYTY